MTPTGFRQPGQAWRHAACTPSQDKNRKPPIIHGTIHYRKRQKIENMSAGSRTGVVSHPLLSRRSSPSCPPSVSRNRYLLDQSMCPGHNYSAPSKRAIVSAEGGTADQAGGRFALAAAAASIASGDTMISLVNRYKSSIVGRRCSSDMARTSAFVFAKPEGLDCKRHARTSAMPVSRASASTHKDTKPISLANFPEMRWPRSIKRKAAD